MLTFVHMTLHCESTEQYLIMNTFTLLNLSYLFLRFSVVIIIVHLLSTNQKTIAIKYPYLIFLESFKSICARRRHSKPKASFPYFYFITWNVCFEINKSIWCCQKQIDSTLPLFHFIDPKIQIWREPSLYRIDLQRIISPTYCLN